MDKEKMIEGEVFIHPNGFGFAKSLYEERFFIRPSLAKQLISGDWVTFSAYPGKNPQEFQVGNIHALDREPRKLLGELIETADGSFRLVPDEACFLDIFIDKAESISSKDVVAVEVPGSTALSSCIKGNLVVNLGRRSREGFEHDYALHKFNLSNETHLGVIEEAEQIDSEVLEHRTKGWADLRHIPFVTIDGESTTDMDDAVHVVASAGGLFRVDVAIADVAAYVKPGSALEIQAKSRLTSLYFPDKTIHMLPEALSSELGSLKEGVARLALVCSLRVDAKGAILERRFRRGIIVSRARLSYKQVQRRIETAESLSDDPQVEKSLDKMHALYLELAKSRKTRGVLEFNSKEPKLITDEKGTRRLVWEARTDAHKLIEELMLLANRAAAEELCEKGLLALYRHQAVPRDEDWEELKKELSEKGILLEGGPSIKRLAEAVDSAPAGQVRQFAETAARQIMRRAVYHTVEPGHFSLGFNAYAHFTSPLRRYSDLLTHRLLLGEKVTADELEQAAKQCSQRSSDARDAERFLWDRIKKKFIIQDVPRNEKMLGIALFTSQRGVRVILNQWNCTAFVPAEQLEAAGFSWQRDARQWVNDRPLETGEQVTVRWLKLKDERGVSELIAELC